MPVPIERLSTPGKVAIVKNRFAGLASHRTFSRGVSRSAVSTACVLLLATAACHSEPASGLVPVQTGTVTVEIQGDGKARSLELADVPEGTTVEEVMRALSDQGLDVELSGSGTTAFLVEMDGLGTEAGKGWLYTIDGEFPQRGIGTTEILPPTTIRWRHGEMPTATE